MLLAGLLLAGCSSPKLGLDGYYKVRTTGGDSQQALVIQDRQWILYDDINVITGIADRDGSKVTLTILEVPTGPLKKPEPLQFDLDSSGTLTQVPKEGSAERYTFTKTDIAPTIRYEDGIWK